MEVQGFTLNPTPKGLKVLGLGAQASPSLPLPMTRRIFRIEGLGLRVGLSWNKPMRTGLCKECHFEGVGF